MDKLTNLIVVMLAGTPIRKTVFRYDGLGRRTAIISPDGVETRYLWCGEAICQARDSRDAVSRRYYPEGELIPGGGRLHYATDHLGSVRDLLSLDDGSRVASFDYDPYGNPVLTYGSVASDFRYAGMFYHPDSGLYLTQFRAYDPRTGRWLSRDPMGEDGGTNLYGYVDGNPIAKVDPKGDLSTWSSGGVLTGLYGSLRDRFDDLVRQHYARNQYNVVVPLEYAEKHWREMAAKDSRWHMMGGAWGNRKFVSANGHCEVVYRPNGAVETNPLNMGSYNYADPEDFWGHLGLDVLPYLILGNTPEDMFTWRDRLGVIGSVAWQELYWATHPSIDVGTGALIWP